MMGLGMTLGLIVALPARGALDWLVVSRCASSAEAFSAATSVDAWGVDSLPQPDKMPSAATASAACVADFIVLRARRPRCPLEQLRFFMFFPWCDLIEWATNGLRPMPALLE
jgi:hypothetical protein